MLQERSSTNFHFRRRNTGGESSALAAAGKAKVRNELLVREIFYALRAAKVLIEAWRKRYNEFRPRCSLRYRPVAPTVYWSTDFRSYAQSANSHAYKEARAGSELARSDSSSVAGRLLHEQP